MILPIYAIGNPVLKKEAQDIESEYPDLQELIANMKETMYNANGIGLAAPQIGLSIRLFIIDTVQLMEEGEESEGLNQVFINAQKIEEGGDEWVYEEGCLSIPEVRGDINRPSQLRIQYLDENFEAHEKVFTGLNARVIQHEYDHIDGILFTEMLKPIKRRLMKRRIDKIKKGEINPEYKMRFYKPTR